LLKSPNPLTEIEAEALASFPPYPLLLSAIQSTKTWPKLETSVVRHHTIGLPDSLFRPVLVRMNGQVGTRFIGNIVFIYIHVHCARKHICTYTDLHVHIDRYISETCWGEPNVCVLRFVSQIVGKSEECLAPNFVSFICPVSQRFLHDTAYLFDLSAWNREIPLLQLHHWLFLTFASNSRGMSSLVVLDL
jgi:hypothetical protein